ncbi:hypothetical protein ACA910_019438 [Epithemia clementina (nom. ined.)]
MWCLSSSQNHLSSLFLIFTANYILKYALLPGPRGVHKNLHSGCAGIAIMSVVDAGLMFCGSAGSGIVIAKLDDGSWSSPVTCRFSGAGFGLVVGLQNTTVLMFLPDKHTVNTFISTGVKLGGKKGLTIGVGRELGVAVGTRTSSTTTTNGNKKKAPKPIFSTAFTKGAFYSSSLDGIWVREHQVANNAFYGKTVEPADNLEGRVCFPSDKESCWPRVLEKLSKLDSVHVREDEKREERQREVLDHSSGASPAVQGEACSTCVALTQ